MAGTIITLRNEIERLIGLMAGVTYLRGSRSEANMALDKLAVGTGCIAIHTDQSTATAIAPTAGGTYLYKDIPTQILFVYKNTKMDDKLYAVDSLVDAAEQKADEFYDHIIQSSVFSKHPALPGYDCQRLEAHKISDTILSGVLFTCLIPVDKSTYICDFPS